MSAQVARFLTGISDVLAAADAGGPHSHGVTALTRLVDITAEVLDTELVTYAEVVGRKARTLSTSRAGRFLLGRQTDLTDTDVAGLSTGRAWESDVTGAPLAGHVAYIPVVLHESPVGRLELYLARPLATQVGPVLRLAAATAAHLVGDHEAGYAGSEASGSDLFLAAAGHELRTPATVIKGYADTLRHRWTRLDDDARLEAVNVIAQRADALAALADRLLSGANASLGGEPDLRVFDLADAVRGVLAELPADLVVRLDADVPERVTAYGDASCLALVLGELATNAVRYSPEDAPISVRVFTERSTACLRVADRGAGLTPDQARMAFERFWQAERGDDRRYGGVGLGLYLVRQIVERQHGWVSLQPRPGGGTIIDVRLPSAVPEGPR